MITVMLLLSHFTMNYMDTSYFAARPTPGVEAVSTCHEERSQRDIPHYPTICSEARHEAPA